MKICEICSSEGNYIYVYRTKYLCMECANEYRMIFEKAIESQRPSGNLEGNDWFQKFKEGWEAIEREKNLAPIEIPEEIRAYYHRIWGIVPEDDTKGSK